MSENKPFSGLRVVDFSTYVAATTCGRILAEWGADVIKVESIKGDAWRLQGKLINVTATEEENPIFDVANANKRGVSIDLKAPEGKEIMFKLLDNADVMITNTRVEALKKLGLDYDSLKDRYPRLIYALVTGYGEKGPDAKAPGFDVAAFWSRNGFLTDMTVKGEYPNYPIYPAMAFGDATSGATLFGGISAALYAREKTGKGDKISVSLYGMAIWCSQLTIIQTQEKYGRQYPTPRYAGNPLVLPYLCADGEWVTLAIMDFKKDRVPLFRATGLDDMIDDPRFMTTKDFMENREIVIRRLEEQFAKKDSSEWLKILREHDIVNNLIGHMKDVCKDEQAWANDFLYDFTCDSGTKVAFPCAPVKSDNLGLPSLTRGPHIGEHTKAVLQELGYSDEAISSLLDKKIVRA